MRRLPSAFFALASLYCGLLCPPRLAAQTSSTWTLDGVLAMLDKSAQDFHTLTADIEHIKYTAVVKDSSTESGQIFVRRDDKMRIDFQKPDPRTILRSGEPSSFSPPKSIASRNTTLESTARLPTSIWRWDSERKAKRCGRITL